MIQQVIPMDLIPSYLPSYLIYTFSFPLSDVVITPPAPRQVVPTPAGCRHEVWMPKQEKLFPSLHVWIFQGQTGRINWQ